MNWYYEQNGVSQGPVQEVDLMDRVRAKEVSEDTLIYHPGMEEWKSVRELKPEWVKPVPVPVPTPVQPARKVAAKAAPASAPKADEGEEKPGLFKRLFGKKK